MKISELQNAPQWLKDAKVENENVEIINGIVVWRDGVWQGGVWRGGVWMGGGWNNSSISRIDYMLTGLGIVFDEKGIGIAYRKTRKDGKGCYTPGFIQKEGEFYEDINDYEQGVCKKGIHVSSLMIAHAYFNQQEGDEYWKVEFKREDVLDTDGDKVRIRGGKFSRIQPSFLVSSNK